MGKHSAPTGRATRRRPGAPETAPDPSSTPTPDPSITPADRTLAVSAPPQVSAAPRETPPVLKQTAALLTLAVVVVMFALVWTGLGPTPALALGVGLLALGAVAFFVVRRAGLLSGDEVDPPV
jgi:hypothetical protein